MYEGVWGSEMGRKEGEKEENMKDWEGRVGRRTEKDSKERDTLIEGAFMGLGNDPELGKFPETPKDDSS